MWISKKKFLERIKAERHKAMDEMADEITPRLHEFQDKAENSHSIANLIKKLASAILFPGDLVVKEIELDDEPMWLVYQPNYDSDVRYIVTKIEEN